MHASVVAQQPLKNIAGLGPGTFVFAQGTKVRPAGRSFEPSDRFFAVDQIVGGCKVFAKKYGNRQAQAFQQFVVQRIERAQFEGRKVFTAPQSTRGQLRKAGGKDVGGVLQVDHEHQDFLRAIGVTVTDAFLADVRQVGTNRCAQQIQGLVDLPHFIGIALVRGLEQLQHAVEHDREHVGQPQGFARRVGQADVCHREAGFIQIERHAGIDVPRR